LAGGIHGLRELGGVAGLGGIGGVLKVFLQLLIGGIAQGCIYGLIALGFVLIYKTTATVSFVQGEFMMLGAFGGLAGMTVLGLPYGLAAAGALLAVAALGLLLERVAVRPAVGQSGFAVVLLTIGLGCVARGGITLLPGIGADTQALLVPYKDAIWHLGGVVLNMEHVVVIATTAVLCTLLHALLRYSTLSIAMQAAAQSPLAARYMGIPVQRMHGIAWSLAATLAAVAGLLLAPMAFVQADMGFIGLKALPAAVVGGLCSLPGALAGGLLIGLAESLSGAYLPDGFRNAIAYAMVLVMLMLKPHGLMGAPMRQRA